MSKYREKRKKMLEIVKKRVGAMIYNDSHNMKLYEKLFKESSDEDLLEIMTSFRDKKQNLQVIIPNDDTIKVDLDNNNKILKEMGVTLISKLHYHTDKGVRVTPIKHLVIPLPIRVNSQTIDSKLSVVYDTKVKNELTGQVTGDSRASKISKPEAEILISHGLDKTLKEFMKYRGGDLGSLRALETVLENDGVVSQELLERASTGVVSTRVVDIYLKSAMLKSTLLK